MKKNGSQLYFIIHFLKLLFFSASQIETVGPMAYTQI